MKSNLGIIVFTALLLTLFSPALSLPQNHEIEIYIADSVAEYLILTTLIDPSNEFVVLNGSGVHNLISQLSLYLDASLVLVREIADYEDVFNKSIEIAQYFNSKLDSIVMVNVENESLSVVASLIASALNHPLIMYENRIELEKLKNLGVENVFTIGVGEDVVNKLKEYFNVQSIHDISEALAFYNSMLSNSKTLTIALKNDELAFISALYAKAKKSRFIIVDKIRKENEELVNSLAGIEKVILVSSFKNLKTERAYSKLLNILMKGGVDEKYIEPAVALISGISKSHASIFAVRTLNSGRILRKLNRGQNLIFMDDSYSLTQKIIRIGRRAGLVPKTLYSVGKRGNITTGNIINLLNNGNMLTYINLHGNPLGYGLTTYGPYVLHAGHVSVIAPTIIVTLSCLTCDFDAEYLYSAKESIALKFVSAGALAYVGASRTEFTNEIEISTAYPELIVYLLTHGVTLGEAVRIINNIHIKEKKGPYMYLIGDPDIVLDNINFEYRVETVSGNELYRIEITNLTEVVYVKFIIDRNRDDIKKFEEDTPNIFKRIYVEKTSEGKYIVNVFMTKIFSSDVGDFKPGESIKLKIIYKPSLQMIVLTIALVAFSLVAVMLLLKRHSK